MFDMVAGILENGTVAGILENRPYCPKDASRNSWEGWMRDYFDDTDNCRKTSVSQTLNRPEARILIYGDGGGIRIESSLPKLLYGNNVSTVSNAQPALKRQEIRGAVQFTVWPTKSKA